MRDQWVDFCVLLRKRVGRRLCTNLVVIKSLTHVTVSLVIVIPAIGACQQPTGPRLYPPPRYRSNREIWVRHDGQNRHRQTQNPPRLARLTRVALHKSACPAAVNRLPWIKAYHHDIPVCRRQRPLRRCRCGPAEPGLLSTASRSNPNIHFHSYFP